MAYSYQGASNSGGSAGLPPALIQPVGGKHAVPQLALTRLEQPSQEQLLLNQMRKLTVRLLVGTFDRWVNKLPGDTRSLLKHPWNCRRYDPILPMRCPPDRLSRSCR